MSRTHFCQACQVLALIVFCGQVHSTLNDIGYGYCPEAKKNKTKRIVGGEPAKSHTFPWLVSIQNKTSSGDSRAWTHICTGSIIQADSIITAASCFKNGQGLIDLEDQKNLIVVAGLQNLDDTLERSKGRQYRDVHAIHTNSKYNGSGGTVHEVDMALVHLTRPFVFNRRILPICITRYEGKVGVKCTVAGWGEKLRVGKGAKGSLNSASVPVLDPDKCRGVKLYELCAGYTEGFIDACKGDTGAPLVCLAQDERWVQIGIVSRPGCGKKSQPTIYTDLSDKASHELAFLANIDSRPPNVTSEMLRRD